MPHRKSGFTLIELLVVIAIIAILAAILFPVFAKARESARGASSQSNIKQQALGVLMYVQDYDETYPLDCSWNKAGVPISVGGVPVAVWSWDILPYIKNGQIFGDPLASPPTGAAIPWWVYLSQYGYNYTVLSPTVGWGPFVKQPNSLAVVQSPAATVMIAGKMTYAEQGNFLWWYGPYSLMTLATVEPPDCYTIPPDCFENWGTGSGLWGWVPAYAGGNSGQVSQRKAENTNLAFCDGHAKFMTGGQAAAGTNWNSTLPVGQLKVIDYSKYMWDTL